MQDLQEGGSPQLMHMPRTHRVDAALVSESVNGQHIDMLYTMTMDMVADIGTKRFTDTQTWLKALYQISIVSLKIWGTRPLPEYYQCQTDDGLPLSPGGCLSLL